MKIACYTICKNEAKHAERYMASMGEANGVFLTDTGSTDGSQETLRKLGAKVQEADIKPWRHDLARNISLEFVPEEFDIAICADLDETFRPGWRKQLEQEWKDGITKLKHPIISTFKPDGITPELIFDAERIHARKGYRWRHACHEATYWINKPELQKLGWANITLEHRPDNSKSRSSYLPLLEMMAQEEPESDRAAHYLGRELYFKGLNDRAIAEFKRHLSLKSSVWDAERASSMRYIAAMMNVTPGRQQERLCWLLRACAEAPAYREPWVELAQAYFDNKDYVGCYYAADRALSLVHRLRYHHTKESVWAEWPHDLKGCAAYFMGLHVEALNQTKRAAELAPGDARIAGNLEMMGREMADRMNATLPNIRTLPKTP